MMRPCDPSQLFSAWTRAGSIFFLLILLTSCGEKKDGGDSGGPALTPVEAAFAQASQDTGVPARLMLAVAYLESRLSSVNATADYLTTSSSGASTGGAGAKTVARGTLMTQTAFGKTCKDLDLDPAKPESQTLEGQVTAYAKWVQSQLKTAGVSLTSTLQTPEDRFYWIENLALLQRKGLAQRRNVQITFARELIQILNQGFIWQDPRDATLITFPKEDEPISLDKFPANGQSWFNLSEIDAQIFGVKYLPLVTVPSAEFVNKPKHIEVVHCPLSLSSCLELQTRASESDVHLAAHYIIPQVVPDAQVTDANLNGVLQVADHKQALILTDAKGDNVPVEDAVIVMLVGNSGRLVSGTRQPALPNWFTDSQLRAMAQVINDVCTLLSQTDGDVKRDQCMSIGGNRGIRFHEPPEGEEIRWGDIADFDPTIFAAYVQNPGGLGTEVKFDFSASGKQFKAGDKLPLPVLFDSSARTVEFERLSRCPNSHVVWQPVSIQDVRSQTNSTYQDVLYDSGPNRNGDQFFRVRVYGKDGHLLGWSIDDVLLHDYETDAVSASDKYCGVASKS